MNACLFIASQILIESWERGNLSNISSYTALPIIGGNYFHPVILVFVTVTCTMQCTCKNEFRHSSWVQK